MTEKRKKKISLCQGDKSELEKITGEDFDYLEGTEPFAYGDRFAGTYCELWIEKLATQRPGLELGDRMCEWALEARADAVIHYTAGTYSSGLGVGGYVRGTLMKRKK